MILRARVARLLGLLCIFPLAAAASCSSKSTNNPPPHPIGAGGAGGAGGGGGAGGAGVSSSHSASSSGKSASSSQSSASSASSSGSSSASSSGSGGGGDCMDGVKNQDETDIDCGGMVCGPCAAGAHCVQGADCGSHICDQATSKCTVASCSDGVKNGSESDIDCGGGCPNKCFVGKKCGNKNDCRTGLCTAGVCACPAGMVIMPIPGVNGGYCVDAFEVTYGDYSSFWANNPIGNQVPACQWNMSFTPANNWPGDPAHPVTDVDWCDALAYCTYAGKHLCGNINGGPNKTSDFIDDTQSQWFNACSAQNANAYPYGNTYKADTCEGMDQGNMNMFTTQVCAMPGCKHTRAETEGAIFMSCQGGAPGLFQMSGNVAEWEDSCDVMGNPTQTDNCLVRGGSHCDGQAGLTCKAYAGHPRNYTGCDVGFRCCL